MPLNSRHEFNVLHRFFKKDEFDAAYLQEELELAQHHLPEPDYEELRALMLENAQPNDVWRAAAFFKLIRHSYSCGCTSYSCQPFDIRKVFAVIWEASRRLADTVVENKDFEALIRQYDRDDAFFYCDPPYYETEEYSLRELFKQRLRAVLCKAYSKGSLPTNWYGCPIFGISSNGIQNTMIQ